MYIQRAIANYKNAYIFSVYYHCCIRENVKNKPLCYYIHRKNNKMYAYVARDNNIIYIYIVYR